MDIDKSFSGKSMANYFYNSIQKILSSIKSVNEKSELENLLKEIDFQIHGYKLLERAMRNRDLVMV